MSDFENINLKAASEDTDYIYSSYRPSNDLYYWYTFGFGCMAFYLLLAVLFLCYQIGHFVASNYSNYIAHQKRREQTERAESSPPSAISPTGSPQINWANETLQSVASNPVATPRSSLNRLNRISEEEEVQRRPKFRRDYSPLPEHWDETYPPASHQNSGRENLFFDTRSLQPEPEDLNFTVWFNNNSSVPQMTLKLRSWF